MKSRVIEEINKFIEKYSMVCLTANSLVIRENEEEIKKLTNWMNPDTSTGERVYVLLNDLSQSDILCPICKINNRKFYTKTKGYRNGCSLSCSVIYQNQQMDKEAASRKTSLTFKLKSKEEIDSSTNKRIKTTKEKYGEDAFQKIALISSKTAKERGVIPFKLFRENCSPDQKHEMALKAGSTMKSKVLLYNGVEMDHYTYVNQKKLDDIDENGHNFYERMHIKKLNDIDENGHNFYDRMILKNYESGFWVKPEDRGDFEHYCVKINKEMYKYKKEISCLENFHLRGNANVTGAYHLDHRYSKFEGFRNNVPVYIIGHICNLEMITARNNLSKSRNCSIELNDLLHNIDNYNSEKSIN